MAVPILRQGHYLIATMPSEVSDSDLDRLETDLARLVGEHRSRGVVVDVTVMEVMDSYTIRILLEIGRVNRLRGAETVIVGIRPDVAFAMVQLGVTLEGVRTALDLEEAIRLLEDLALDGERS